MIKPLAITNSLTRTKDVFKPINSPHAGMYSCGPTVYSYPTVGNYRTYVAADVVYRTLKMNGYEVTYVMNLTDVGHLTGDNEGDADQGEDRLEKAASKEGKNAWEIAKFYSEDFVDSFQKLNMVKPNILAPATEHIPEQIELIKDLEERGFTYNTSDGVYFDTQKYEQQTQYVYGELSTMDQIKEGARVEPNREKKSPRDFALWKFSEKPGLRHMEWESPWGMGFPGWHIECSAMSMKYLGDSFDIHLGGEDLRQTHHPNEIAQSQAATGRKFVNYWIHATFLQVDGKRMGKSLGNAFTLQDVEQKGIDLMALRYFYLQAHYRDTLNFTWDALEAAQNALNNLRSSLGSLLQKREHERTKLSDEKLTKIDDYNERFTNALNDDFNTPQALAVMWEAIKSNVPTPDKIDLIYNFDEVLGLKMREVTANTQQEMPQEIVDLMTKRDEFRNEGNFEEADKIRQEIEQKGFSVQDTKLNA